MHRAKSECEKMRIIFMGTPDFAVPSLNALVEAGHDVCAVYAQPPRPSGRKMTLTPTPVHARALELGIVVNTPVSLRSAESQSEFAAFEADLAVVAAYGLILPPAILDAPRLGCINVHGSLLPRWRGAAPVHRAILAGDAVTGITIMDMDVGLDTGAMRASTETTIAGKTAGELTVELSYLGAKLLIDVVGNLAAHPAIPQPEEGVTYAAKIDKSESHIDFLVSAPQVVRQIRAFAPSAWFASGDERIRIVAADILPPDHPLLHGANGHTPGTVMDDQLSIACNPGAIRPTRVQRAGKGQMSTADLLRGLPIPPGTRLS
jgi:methionyl-tRNA formyltransferase